MIESKEALIVIAKQGAVVYGLNPILVCAVCEQESNWNPWAVRMEPAFYDKYTKPMSLSDTEEHCRAISWGLMQVMGQTAREHGFKGRFLSELCHPATGVDIGCKVLKAYIDSKGRNITAGLLRYNGGGNIAYPQQVMDRMANYA